jgi:hypothetical protein
MIERLRSIQAGLTTIVGSAGMILALPQVQAVTQPALEAAAGAAIAEYGPYAAAGVAILNLYRKARAQRG